MSIHNPNYRVMLRQQSDTCWILQNQSPRMIDYVMSQVEEDSGYVALANQAKSRILV